MTDRWHAGNANDDGASSRGWIVGHFIDSSHGVRSSKDVEVKWAHHTQGEERADWTADDKRTTLVILIDGHFRVQTTEGSATFINTGDYAMWGPGVDHTWKALGDSVVLTVRWPSSPQP